MVDAMSLCDTHTRTLTHEACFQDPKIKCNLILCIFFTSQSNKKGTRQMEVIFLMLDINSMNTLSLKAYTSLNFPILKQLSFII